MIRVFSRPAVILFLVSCGLCAQEHDFVPDVIYGEVITELEPIYGAHIDTEYPLDIPTASHRALQEAAMIYSAIIYGWDFYYEIGERARRIDENIELNPIGSIRFGDPGLRVLKSEMRDMSVWVRTEYYLTETQQRRMQVWRTGTIRNAQAVGYSFSMSAEEFPGWLEIKKAALDDAARIALRSMLRGSERNRPKEVTGFISLASFPHFYISGGRWAVSARFRIQVKEIVPFSAY